MESGKRRYVRVAGPFDGGRVGVFNTPVRIYDLSEGGCFVESSQGTPKPGQHFVLKIDLPDESRIFLKAEIVYVKPDSGFAVSFIDVPLESAERLRRGLLRLRGLQPEAEPDRPVMLPMCPHCHGTSIRALGMAGSTLPWFTCDSCQHVWAAREDVPAPIPEDEPPPTAEPAGGKRILIADDDGGVLGVLVKALSAYRVLTARDVAEAWRLGTSAPVDLLITDYLMPDGTGEELISKLRRARPSLKVLVLTGHGAMLDAEGPDWWKAERHMGKPLNLGELRKTVAELIGA